MRKNTLWWPLGPRHAKCHVVVVREPFGQPKSSGLPACLENMMFYGPSRLAISSRPEADALHHGLSPCQAGAGFDSLHGRDPERRLAGLCFTIQPMPVIRPRWHEKRGFSDPGPPPLPAQRLFARSDESLLRPVWREGEAFSAWGQVHYDELHVEDHGDPLIIKKKSPLLPAAFRSPISQCSSADSLPPCRRASTPRLGCSPASGRSRGSTRSCGSG